MSAPSDFTIVGTVLALAVAILLLSGLALYVAFRLREMFHEEKGGSTRAVKVAFLVGLLFMSGGVFYFFASGFSASGGGTSQATSTPSGISSSSTSLTSTTAGASTTSPTTVSSTTDTTVSTATSSTATDSTSAGQGVYLPAPSCASSRVTAGSTFSCSITVDNEGSSTYTGGSVYSGGDFSKFAFLSCSETVNGAQMGSTPTYSNYIAVGDLSPGTTVLTCSIQAPAQAGQYNNSELTLNAIGLPQPVTVTFSIQVFS